MPSGFGGEGIIIIIITEIFEWPKQQRHHEDEEGVIKDTRIG